MRIMFLIYQCSRDGVLFKKENKVVSKDMNTEKMAEYWYQSVSHTGYNRGKCFSEAPKLIRMESNLSIKLSIQENPVIKKYKSKTPKR